MELGLVARKWLASGESPPRIRNFPIRDNLGTCLRTVILLKNAGSSPNSGGVARNAQGVASDSPVIR